MFRILRRRTVEPCMSLEELSEYIAYRRQEGWTEAKIEMVMHYLIYEQDAKHRSLTRTEVLEILGWQFNHS